MNVSRKNLFRFLSEGRELTTPEERRKQAVRMSLVVAVLMGLTALVAYIATQVSPNYKASPRALALMLGLSALGWISAWLARSGRVQLGIWLVVIGQMILLTVNIGEVVPGQSAVIALVSFLQIVGLTIGSLPLRQALLAGGLSLLQGLGFIAYEYLLPHPYYERNYIAGVGLLSAVALIYIFLNRYLLSRAPLRARLSVAFLAVALTPLILLAAMNTQRQSDEQSATARRELGSAAGTVATAVDTYVQQALDAVRTEARLPEIVAFMQNPTGDSALAQSTLRSLALKDPVFVSSYALLDENGKNILDTAPGNVGSDESSRSYFQVTVSSGRPYLSPVMFYNQTARLYVAAPIRDAQSQVLGVMRVEYNAAVLQWLVSSSLSSGRNLYVVLLDNDNYMRLAHSSQPELIYQTYTSLTDEQAANLQRLFRLPPGKAKEIGRSQPDVIDGLRNISQEPYFSSAGAAVSEQTVSTAVNVRLAPWIVLSRTPVSTIEETVAGQTRSSVLLAILIAILVTAFAAVIVQYFTRPIVDLTQVARQVAAGDLTVQAAEGQQDEIGELGSTFNQMTAQLRDILGGLEQRVAERTRALELSSDVSRRLSTILNTEQLVSEVVELLQFAFNYYHVHIYLWDDAKENLRMMGGTGEAGKIMLAGKHSIPRGRGLVGQACETGAVVLVQDTRSDPNWLPNPLLPETRAEIAVPILLGDEVLGALDVQQNTVNGLTQQDADLLRGIGGQVAIALRNARQYDQAEQHAHRDARLTEIIDQIERTQSVQEALQVTARELGRELNLPRIQARLHLGGNGEGVSQADQERQS